MTSLSLRGLTVLFNAVDFTAPVIVDTIGIIIPLFSPSCRWDSYFKWEQTAFLMRCDLRGCPLEYGRDYATCALAALALATSSRATSGENPNVVI